MENLKCRVQNIITVHIKEKSVQYKFTRTVKVNTGLVTLKSINMGEDIVNKVLFEESIGGKEERRNILVVRKVERIHVFSLVRKEGKLFRWQESKGDYFIGRKERETISLVGRKRETTSSIGKEGRLRR